MGEKATQVEKASKYDKEVCECQCQSCEGTTTAQRRGQLEVSSAVSKAAPPRLDELQGPVEAGIEQSVGTSESSEEVSEKEASSEEVSEKEACLKKLGWPCRRGSMAPGHPAQAQPALGLLA